MLTVAEGREATFSIPSLAKAVVNNPTLLLRAAIIKFRYPQNPTTHRGFIGKKKGVYKKGRRWERLVGVNMTQNALIYLYKIAKVFF